MKFFNDMHDHLLKHQKKYIGLAAFAKVMVIGLFLAIGMQAIQHTYAQKGVVYLIKSTAGENGTITPLGESYVSQHYDQTFSITPSNHYGISTLTVDGAPEALASSYTFVDVIAPHTIDATFGALPWYIDNTITCGRGKIPNTIMSLNFNTVIKSLSPLTNFRIDGTEYIPSVDGSTSSISFNLWTSFPDSDSHTLTILKDTTRNDILDTKEHTLTFSTDCYPNIDITVTAGAGGSITPSWIVSINGEKTFTITPDAGYIVENLKLDGTPVTPTPTTSYTYNASSKISLLEVTFKKTNEENGAPKKDDCRASSTLACSNKLGKDYSWNPNDGTCCSPTEQCKKLECLDLQGKADALAELVNMFGNPPRSTNLTNNLWLRTITSEDDVWWISTLLQYIEQKLIQLNGKIKPLQDRVIVRRVNDAAAKSKTTEIADITALLQDMAQKLKDMNNVMIRIEGHTDGKWGEKRATPIKAIKDGMQ